MIISEWYHIPTFLSLAVIALILAVSIIASIVLDRKDQHGPDEVIDAHHGEGLKMFETDED
jgi:hypothetical protein